MGTSSSCLQAIWVFGPTVLCLLVIPVGLTLFVVIDNKTAPGRPPSPLWMLVLIVVPLSTVFLMYVGLIALAMSTWNFGP
jgi:hypothetical protein